MPDFINNPFFTEGLRPEIFPDYSDYVQWYEKEEKNNQQNNLQNFNDEQFKSIKSLAQEKHSKEDLYSSLLKFLNSKRILISRRLRALIERRKVIKGNPYHNFELLKKHRLSLFEVKKKLFLLDRWEQRDLTSIEDRNQYYTFWLFEELKEIGEVISDTDPYGNKKGWALSSNQKAEVLKYRQFVNDELEQFMRPQENNSKDDKLKTTFENLPEKEAAFVLRILEHFKVTKDGIYQPNGRKNILRAIVEVCIEKNILPDLGIHPLDEIIADKINMPLTFKLSEGKFIEEDKRKIKAFIMSNYLKT